MAMARQLRFALALAVIGLAGAAPSNAQSLGTIHFPTSAKPAAQGPFETGVKAMYNFEFDQARVAFQAAGKADQVRIIGFDGAMEGKQAILKGQIVCDPIQFPDQMGRTTIEMIIKYFNGDDVPPEVLIPSSLYYQADAEKDLTLVPK